MLNFNLKPLMVAIGFSLASSGTIAATQLTANRTVLNNADHATVVANFQPAVSGDLYVATVINGVLNFIADQGKTLTTDVKPFQLNGTFDGNLKLLDVIALKIAPGSYPLYEVVAFRGANVMDFSNWIGGLGGLHRLNFSIGLPVSITNDVNGDGFPDDDSNYDGFRDEVVSNCNSKAARDRDHDDDDDNGHDDDDDNDDNNGHGNKNNNVTSTTNCSSSNTPTPVTPTPVTPTPVTPTPMTPKPVTPTPVTPPPVDTTKGQALYKSLTCSGGGCHTANPAQNRNKILSGKTVAGIKKGISKNPGDMGFLSGTSDADLQLIADYLSTF